MSDDHAVVRAAVVRAGVAAFLDGELGVRVVGQASNGRAALTELPALERQGHCPTWC